MGVLATRSPHRPCPIGLTVAKVRIYFTHSFSMSIVSTLLFISLPIWKNTTVLLMWLGIWLGEIIAYLNA